MAHGTPLNPHRDTNIADRQAAINTFNTGSRTSGDPRPGTGGTQPGSQEQGVPQFDPFTGLPVDPEAEPPDFVPQFWQDSLWAYIIDEASAQADSIGLSPFEFSSIMGASRQSVFDWTQAYMDTVTLTPGQDLKYWTSDPSAIRLLQAVSWNQFRALNPVFGVYSGGTAAQTSGGGARGPSGPTAQDIRNRYDIEQLAQGADNIWRRVLLRPPENSRSMAKAYVDEIVRGKGEVTVDFNAFVRRRAMDTNLFAVIYENKPDDLEPEEYLARYAQMAASVAAPDNVAGLAIEGARLGADPQSFASRLERTDEVTGSAPFINGLEGRMRALNSVFKG